MTRQKTLLLLAVALALLGACSPRGSRRPRQDAKADFELRGVWDEPHHCASAAQTSPPVLVVAFWPALAVVARTQPEAGKGVVSDSTIFLVVGPGLARTDPAHRLIAHTRLAEPCLWGNGSCMGGWLSLGPPGSLPVFVFVDESGGSAGGRVRVFDHVAFGGGPSWPQEHSFRRVFEGFSRHGIYIGDVNQDGRDELVLPTEDSNGTGVPRPMVFRAVAFDGSDMVVVGTVTEDELRASGARSATRILTSGSCPNVRTP